MSRQAYSPVACLCMTLLFPPIHTESLVSHACSFSAISILPFLCPCLCFNKQPAPNWFFLTGTRFATSVLKFVISGTEEVILAVHGVTGVVIWVLLALQDLTPQKIHHTPISLSLHLGHLSHHCPLPTGEIHLSPAVLSVTFTSFSRCYLSHPAVFFLLCLVAPFVVFW